MLRQDSVLKSSSDRQGSDDRRIMIFSPCVGGHHPVYLQHLIEYWCTAKLSGHLFAIVSPELLTCHADMFDLSAAKQHRICFVPIAQADYHDIVSQRNYLLTALKEWQLLRRFARQLQATHCLIMSIDHFQPILASGADLGCDVSGIYLRPTFHYPTFAVYERSWRGFVQHARQRLILSRVLQNRRLKFLFCLDPLAVEHVQQTQPTLKLRHLPDPVKQYPSSAAKVKELREQIDPSGQKKLFLLFGRLGDRKGVYKVLEAIQTLDAALAKRLCLVLVGSILPADQERLNYALKETAITSPAQIVLRDEYISEAEVQQYFEASDVILAPYQKHVGMSGILLLAAAFKKPVLSSNYGLMGELTRRYELGMTVDSTQPQCIAQALTRFLLEPPHQFCDRAKMQQFADDNEAAKFSTTIFDHLHNNESH